MTEPILRNVRVKVEDKITGGSVYTDLRRTKKVADRQDNNLRFLRTIKCSPKNTRPETRFLWANLWKDCDRHSRHARGHKSGTHPAAPTYKNVRTSAHLRGNLITQETHANPPMHT